MAPIAAMVQGAAVAVEARTSRGGAASRTAAAVWSSRDGAQAERPGELSSPVQLREVSSLAPALQLPGWRARCGAARPPLELVAAPAPWRSWQPALDLPPAARCAAAALLDSSAAAPSTASRTRNGAGEIDPARPLPAPAEPLLVRVAARAPPPKLLILLPSPRERRIQACSPLPGAPAGLPPRGSRGLAGALVLPKLLVLGSGHGVHGARGARPSLPPCSLQAAPPPMAAVSAAFAPLPPYPAGRRPGPARAPPRPWGRAARLGSGPPRAALPAGHAKAARLPPPP